MTTSVSMRELLRRAPVLPLVVIETAADAVPLAEALVAGGLSVIEVALRTPAALEAIAAIARAVPQAVVGAGTVRTAADLSASAAAGAHFVVSPGATSVLLAAGSTQGVPAFLPGVATPADVMRAAGFGYSTLKFFPAAAAGGVAMLDALAGPFPEVMFCPTGGIGLAEAPAYLSRANVLAVGGSWVAPPDLIAARDWNEIRHRAAAAASLVPSV